MQCVIKWSAWFLLYLTKTVFWDMKNYDDFRCVWDHQSAADTSLALISATNEWQRDLFTGGSLGFRIPRCGFRIPCLWIPHSTSMDSRFHNQQPGFWVTIMVRFRIPFAGFRIPNPWIPDSTGQNYLDSVVQITLHGAIACVPLIISRVSTVEESKRNSISCVPMYYSLCVTPALRMLQI